MKKQKTSLCKNCGHPIGKVPRGLFILREDAYYNIRINSTGFNWMHLVEYESDQKILGKANIPEYLNELKDIENEFNTAKADGVLKPEQIEEYERRINRLKAQTRFIVNLLQGPTRDSRMFVLRCTGNSGKCKCMNAVPNEKRLGDGSG